MLNHIRHSLRAKITLGLAISLAVILGIITAVEYSRHQRAILTNLSLLAAHSGEVVEANLRHAMLDSDFKEVQALLDAIGSTGDFQVVYLLDTSGQVIFAPNGKDVGMRLDNRSADCQPCHHLPPDDRPGSVVITKSDGQRFFRSMHPIENGPECAACHGSEDRLRGLLLTDIPMAPLEGLLAADLRENLMWGGAIIVVTILVVNLALSRLVLTRLESLSSAISGLGEGQTPPLLAEGEADEIGRVAAAFNVMARQVQTRDRENRKLSETLRRRSAQRGELLKRLISAQEDERKRVARELHDELGQAVGGLAFRVEALRRLIHGDPDQAVSQLDQIEDHTEALSEQMYKLIFDLRPSTLDDIGLTAALHSYLERTLADSEIHFSLDTDTLSERLPPEIETSLYRIFQEAMSNILRHSGARNVSVTLARQNGNFEGSIADDGTGFDLDEIQFDDPDPRGLGLLGMQERAAQCGGHLEIITSPNAGTQVRITIPLDTEAALE